MILDTLFRVKKPIIGMIHLAGNNLEERVKIAMGELQIYAREGVDGVIIENYHGSPQDVETVLRSYRRDFSSLVFGVNILGDLNRAFSLASKYGAPFIQIDSVQTPDLNVTLYNSFRGDNPRITVFGGVGFKYTLPTGNPLEKDLAEGSSRCDVIVTTGGGTGMETPLEKLKKYRGILGEFPLIVGAGVTLKNVSRQLSVADGAIVGSFFKEQGKTTSPVDAFKVRDFMDEVRNLRRN